MNKLIWIILLIAVGYFTYTFLLAPSIVTLSSYKQIRSGMSLSQVESKLGTGLLRAAVFKDITDAMQFHKDVKGEEILILCEQGSRGYIPRQTASNGIIQVEMNASSYRSGGMENVQVSGNYGFRDFFEEMTVNNRRYKLLRNGYVHFSPKPDGHIESWNGKDGRIITVIFPKGKASYWSYQGPAEDFGGLPPQQVSEVAINERKQQVKETVSAPKTSASVWPGYRDPNGRFNCQIPPGWQTKEFPGDPRSKVTFFSGKDEIKIITRETNKHVIEESDRIEVIRNTEQLIAKPGAKGRVVGVTWRNTDGMRGLQEEVEMTRPNLYIRSIKFKKDDWDHSAGIYIQSNARKDELLALFERFMSGYHSGVPRAETPSDAASPVGTTASKGEPGVATPTPELPVSAAQPSATAQDSASEEVIRAKACEQITPENVAKQMRIPWPPPKTTQPQATVKTRIEAELRDLTLRELGDLPTETVVRAAAEAKYPRYKVGDKVELLTNAPTNPRVNGYISKIDTTVALVGSRMVRRADLSPATQARFWDDAREDEIKKAVKSAFLDQRMAIITVTEKHRATVTSKYYDEAGFSEWNGAYYTDTEIRELVQRQCEKKRSAFADRIRSNQPAQSTQDQAVVAQPVSVEYKILKHTNSISRRRVGRER